MTEQAFQLDPVAISQLALAKNCLDAGEFDMRVTFKGGATKLVSSCLRHAGQHYLSCYEIVPAAERNFTIAHDLRGWYRHEYNVRYVSKVLLEPADTIAALRASRWLEDTVRDNPAWVLKAFPDGYYTASQLIQMLAPGA